jgi:hypothetical protein
MKGVILQIAGFGGFDFSRNRRRAGCGANGAETRVTERSSQRKFSTSIKSPP